MYDTVKLAERGTVHRVARRAIVGDSATTCGRRYAERDAWAAGDTVTCRACLNRLRCARGHEDCRTRSLCDRIGDAPSGRLVVLTVGIRTDRADSTVLQVIADAARTVGSLVDLPYSPDADTIADAYGAPFGSVTTLDVYV